MNRVSKSFSREFHESFGVGHRNHGLSRVAVAVNLAITIMVRKHNLLTATPEQIKLLESGNA